MNRITPPVSLQPTTFDPLSNPFPPLATVFGRFVGLPARIRGPMAKIDATRFSPVSPLKSNAEPANPLLNLEGAPLFDKIKAEHAVPAMTQLASDFRVKFSAFENHLATLAAPSYDDVFPVLDDLWRPLAYVAKLVAHLEGTTGSDNDQWSQANNEAEQIVEELGQLSQQSAPLYRAVQAIREGSIWYNLDTAQRRLVDSQLKAMQNKGLGLPLDKRNHFNEINKQLIELSNSFKKNVATSMKSFAELVTDKSWLQGLTPADFAKLADAYNTRHADDNPPPQATPENGPWLLVLDDNVYRDVMSHLENRPLREKLYRARIHVASDGEFDNTQNATRILKLRQELARLLGYETYADLSLSTKIAEKISAADALMQQLLTAAQPVAKREDEALQSFANEQGLVGELQAWDKSFYVDKLRQHNFGFDTELTKQYLNLPLALQGVSEIVGQLFGIRLVDASKEVPLYSPNVYFYKVLNQQGEHIASFYYDPFERPGGKRHGAWMEGLKSYRVDAHGKVVELPVVLLTTNFENPIAGQPARVSMDQLETLVHELGHGLQHMLTHVAYESAAGINNIEWDAVEVASQFMEYWVYQPSFLKKYSRHAETGQSMPDELITKINAAKTFMAANATLRQLDLALTDMELYARYNTENPAEGLHDVHRRIFQQVYGKPPLPDDFFLNTFSHIFSGGYAAGYYGYKWAEVMAADYYSAFEPFLNDPKAIRSIGQRLLETLYESGGGEHPRDVFRSFMGRDYSIKALLRHSGLD